MKSRLLKRIVKDAMKEMPPMTPLEQDHIDRPRNEDARRLLAVAGTLDDLPLDENAREFMPILHRFLQELALDAQAKDRPGAREAVATWLASVEKAVTS